MSGALAQARSMLFVPADRPERYDKALGSGADVVVIDLEDAVGTHAKDSARAALAESVHGLAMPARHRIVVRMNPHGSAWFAGDLALAGVLARQGLAGVMVPKAESAAGLADIARAAPGLHLLPLIESLAGLDALDALAAVPGVVRLCFGHLDLQNELHIHCSPDEVEIAPARWALVSASRRAALPPPVDGVTTHALDPDITAGDAARALRMGFGGKLCIHPAQIGIVHAAFTPGAEQQRWAHRVLTAFAAGGGGACVLDGKMIDAPVVESARLLLARARA